MKFLKGNMAMKAKRIDSRMWSYGNRIIWLNSNANGKRVWGVLSKSYVVMTNGFRHFHEAANWQPA